MSYLMSIDEILEKTREKVDQIKDPELKDKLQWKLGKFPKANDPEWTIYSSIGAFSLPATATEKEVEDKIREYVDKEAQNEDSFYMGTKDPVACQKIYDEKVDIYKNMLGYRCHKGSILSHEKDEQLVQFDVSGRYDPLLGDQTNISMKNSTTLCCDELKKIDELRDKYQNSGVLFKNKNLKKWKDASEEFSKTYSDPYLEQTSIEFDSNDFGSHFYENTTLNWQDNDVAPYKSHDVNEYSYIDKNGNTTKCVRQAETEHNLKKIVGDFSADAVKEEVRTETLTCEDGENVKRELDEKVVTVLNEEKTVNHEEGVGKKSPEDALNLNPENDYNLDSSNGMKTSSFNIDFDIYFEDKSNDKAFGIQLEDKSNDKAFGIQPSETKTEKTEEEGSKSL